jgi:hypothetical protein
MQPTAEQLAQFAEEGYLFLPNCFREEEVATLCEEVEQIYASDRRKVWWRRPAHREPLPRTPITKPSACSAPVPA